MLVSFLFHVASGQRRPLGAWGTSASRVSEVGQRTGVHREARAAVVGARGRRDALYRAGQPVGERLQRELFNGKLRDELLNGEIFYSLAEAAVLVEQWRREYNTVRPHSACGGFPPAPEASRRPGS